MTVRANPGAGAGVNAGVKAEGRSARPGPFASLTALGRTVLDIVHTRFELLVIEIAEEQRRVGELMLYGAIALLCLFLGVVIVAVFVVASLWDTPYRLLATGSMAVTFVLLGAGCALVCVAKARAKPWLFAASLEEVATDLRRLK